VFSVFFVRGVGGSRETDRRAHHERIRRVDGGLTPAPFATYDGLSSGKLRPFYSYLAALSKRSSTKYYLVPS